VGLVILKESYLRREQSKMIRFAWQLMKTVVTVIGRSVMRFIRSLTTDEPRTVDVSILC
jgi:hypothetical protein